MQIVEGPHGTECYSIKGPEKAEAIFAKHGGHLISWKTADGKERLFLSELANYSPTGAIRGGIPVIFPQFNENGPYGRHGFARKDQWTPNFENQTLVLHSTEDTLSIWPFEFELQIGVNLTESGIHVDLRVTNTGAESFAFQAALHTYFAVADVEQITVEGLAGQPFESIVASDHEAADHPSITFGNEVDRAYQGVGDRQVIINQNGNGDSLTIESEGFPDFVVWNPGPDHGIGDLDHWQKFVCIESAQVQLGKPLKPCEHWVGRQIVSVV